MHAIIQGTVSPEDIWLAFEPVQHGEGSTRFKAEDCYLSRGKDAALIRSLVVERGFAKSFLVRISRHPEGLHLGLETLTPVERTEGVRRFLGMIAWRILQASPEATLGPTDFGEFIRE